MAQVDFGRAVGDYGKHRAGFPARTFDLLAGLGIELEGRRVLDLGTGTGMLARELALRGSRVVGLDPSPGMLSGASTNTKGRAHPVGYVQGKAEAIGMRSSSIDLVSAGQCWHWFDPVRVCTEVERVLKPDGRVVLCSFDWVPLPGSVVEATEELILAHNSSWNLDGGDGMHTEYLDDLAQAGFGELESFWFDCDVAYTHVDWRGRIRASAGVGASLDEDAVGRFDAELELVLFERFSADPLLVPHRVFGVTGRRR